MKENSPAPNCHASPSAIRLRGVHVHNLRGVDVDIPHGQLTVLTGVSGSGKSSLAIDTLHAEGQRRYIESFSPKARQHLDRLDKPNVDSIDDLPPSVAIRQNSVTRSQMATVASETGIDTPLHLLFARLGTVFCPHCSEPIEPASATDAVRWIEGLSDGTRLMPVFVASHSGDDNSLKDQLEHLLRSGFTRGLVINQAKPPRHAQSTLLASLAAAEATATGIRADQDLWVIVDRVVAGRADCGRLTESVENCFRFGAGRCGVLFELSMENTIDGESPAEFEFDGKHWGTRWFSNHFECVRCDRAVQKPEPKRLNFQSPAGACPECAGFGHVPFLDWARLVPDPSRSLESDAIALLSGRRWNREKQELLALCREESIPIGRPFRELDGHALSILRDGPEAAYNRTSTEPATESTGGPLRKGSAGLGSLIRRALRENRPSVRDDVARWTAQTACSVCESTRLQPDALTVRLHGNMNIADVAQMTVEQAAAWLSKLNDALSRSERQLTEALVQELENRLRFLCESGLGYVETGRAMSALSSGEARRVGMAAVLGSSLVNTLFVLDEPSAGQHPRDCGRLLRIVQQLRDAGNTVVAVEHQRQFIDAADHIIELGPGPGRQGGTVTYTGPGPTTAPHPMRSSRETHRRPSGSISFHGCFHHTLRDVSVEIPLGCLCVVTGVSGAGKSSLVEQTIYPALCDSLALPCSIISRGTFSTVAGVEQIGDVQLVSSDRLAGGRRSNPATWLKLFGEIRQLFAETQEARSREFTPATFSFNTDSGGRCDKCRGTGSVEIDMQFLSDVIMTCPDCHGTRYQREILEVLWRGRSIADVLNMTTEEAFSFFRGQPKIQKKLQSLKEVGLGYLTLGQPLSTLSGGEAQRLKLASSLAATGKTRSLLILAEPAAGLHSTDTERLLECFDRLLGIGHSLLVVEHNPQVIRAADHIIDIGPEAGPAGGRVVVTGSLEQVRNCPESLTGRWL